VLFSIQKIVSAFFVYISIIYVSMIVLPVHILSKLNTQNPSVNVNCCWYCENML